MKIGMEHKIGEIVMLPDGRKAEVEELKTYGCDGCFFDSSAGCTDQNNWRCGCCERTDHKNIIYKEVK